MDSALRHDYKGGAPKAEPVLTKIMLCRASGERATDSCVARGEAYEDEIPADLVPAAYCSVHGGSGPPETSHGGKREGFFGRILKWFR